MNRSLRLFFWSRLMLSSIFSIQYSGLFPLASLHRSTGQFFPCQKSPSQKTTTRSSGKTISGLPGSVLTFRLKRSPNLLNSRAKSNSCFVPLLRLARFETELAGEAGLRPTNDGLDLRLPLVARLALMLDGRSVRARTFNSFFYKR